MNVGPDIIAGARNLLVNGARLKQGESLLIIREDPALGWYDEVAPQTIIDLARQMGFKPEILDVGGPETKIASPVSDAIRDHNCTIFFARIGDQERFSELPAGCRSVMVYARDAVSLGSAFGQTDHRAMTALKQAVNGVLANANHIEITCPLGTRVLGKPDLAGGSDLADVSVARFPLGVPAPVLATGFSGHVALAHYLTTTGSMPYEPASLPIDGVVFAEIENGRILRFSGETKMVERIERHYNHVSALYDVDRNAVHSFHAGIHPACAYQGSAREDPDRWSNNIFCSPRFLHFHTCGDYAPGEICWMVLDPTIFVDGTSLWENGRLQLQNHAATSDCVAKWPELAPLFDHPDLPIGL